MRDYIRHPSDIPIDFQPEDAQPAAPRVLPEANSNHLKNISQGGLAFHSPESLSPGTLLRIKKNILLKKIARTGAFCKKNKITIDMIKNCIELKEMASRQSGEAVS